MGPVYTQERNRKGPRREKDRHERKNPLSAVAPAAAMLCACFDQPTLYWVADIELNGMN